MSTKKRDLAQELVDFLLKEDELKKAATSSAKNSEQDRTKPHLVQPIVLSEQRTGTFANERDKTEAKADQKTLQKTALADDPVAAIFEFNISVPQAPATGQDAPETKKSMKILEDLAEGDDIKLDLEGPLFKPAAPPTSAPVPEYKTSPGPTTSKQFVSQRASIVFNDVANLMAGTEAVKVAQARIKALEKENDKVRSEMEGLLTSSESLQRRLNELRAQHEGLERKHREKVEILEDEKAVLRTRLNAKEEELARIKKENEELLARFQTDLRKIRVRERELEHRQEIIRAEMTTVVSAKDEVIVELKRQLEKLHFELDNFRAKSADMNTKINEFYDRNHRTVKALRLALSVLETGDSEENKPKVKKEG